MQSSRRSTGMTVHGQPPAARFIDEAAPSPA